MNFEKYINLPYKNLGRDFDGIDCFGLLYLIFKEERNILLPDFTELKYDKDWFTKENHILDNIPEYFTKVNEPYRMFDVPIFYGGCSKEVANHIGMFIDDFRFIHISEQYSSRIDRFNEYWKSRFYGVMRYNGSSNI